MDTYPGTQLWFCIATPEAFEASKSRGVMTPRKAELVLEKAQVGVKWASWGSITMYDTPRQAETADDLAATTSAPPPAPLSTSSSSPLPLATATETTSTSAAATEPPAKPSGPPSYPTSSKRGPQDWDRVAAAATAKDGEEEAGDANAFFEKLFKDSPDDVKRAMKKSMYESGGTVLSTDWGDVGSRKIEVSPPEGVEAKKWDS
jgi:suppressor of G2 allele of SKP1